MSKTLFDKRRIYLALKNKLNIKFKGSYELVGWYFLDGKKLLRFRAQKGRGQMTPGYQKEIENSSRLNNEDFEKLIKCPLRGPGYEKKIRELRDKNLI